MWHRRLKLGTYFRIGVYVHWSFALLVAYVGYAGYQDGWLGMLFGIALLLGMFFCVTLHEYGHALTARRFGIDTLDITLFPIGGVARLMRIPRVPWQELLVAVAGPAVNVVIVAGLLGLFFVAPGLGVPQPARWLSSTESLNHVVDALNSPTVAGYLLSMMLVNTALILFNMIPAFPMDGGRVLRSVLAMGLEYRRATRIASGIGVLCAIGMATAAIHFELLTAGLIAVFICYAGLSEARHVERLEPLRQLAVRDAMIHQPPCLPAERQLGDLIPQLQYCPTAVMPVVASGGVLVGMLTLQDVTAAIRSGAQPWTTAGELARQDVPVLYPDEPLELIVSQSLGETRQFAVADRGGRLVGLLDLETLRARAALRAG